jgi:hypothetical protein
VRGPPPWMSTGELPPSLREALSIRGDRPVVLIDGRNVQRSTWPNLTDGELVRRVSSWAGAEGVAAIVAFDGRSPHAAGGDVCTVVEVTEETADAWLVRAAHSLGSLAVPFWLVTSDRELRALAGRRAERVIGGGGFLRELR